MASVDIKAVLVRGFAISYLFNRLIRLGKVRMSERMRGNGMMVGGKDEWMEQEGRKVGKMERSRNKYT